MKNNPDFDELEKEETSFTNAQDIEILMHRDAHLVENLK